MVQWIVFTAFGLFCFSSAFAEWDLKTRLRWDFVQDRLEATDFYQTYGSNLTNHTFQTRIQANRTSGDWYFSTHSTLSLLSGHHIDVLTDLPEAMQVRPGSDDQRFFDMSYEFLSRDETIGVARLDRFSIKYQKPDWSVTLGREAFSWGNGLLFNPLDVFNPYPPTAIDREFKPGSDLLLVEKLFSDGSDLQALAVMRSETEMDSGSTHTVGLKYRRFLGAIEADIVVGSHFGDRFYGASMMVPVGLTLLRIDASSRCTTHDCAVSAMANIDYTFVIKKALFYVFAEAFHNGVGMTDFSQSESGLPTLLESQLRRGEVFFLMKNYGATGLRFNWHPLWSQTIATITNLHDNSSLLQTVVSYDPNDTMRIQAGATWQLGSEGTEFGKRSVSIAGSAGARTIGGGDSFYVSVAYYR